jgi:putative ABC transport system permease protein
VDPDRRVERDVDDEIAFHLDSRVRDLTAGGASEDAARRIAEAEFGDLAASRHELAAVNHDRDARRPIGRWIEAMAQDLRHAARSLRRSPAFTITATLVLAIGIGASAAIFDVVNGVLLRPLPFGHPDRLVGAWHDMPSIGLMHQPQAPATYFTYQQLARSIEGIGVYREGEVNVADPGGRGDPERLADARVSATLIPVLQVSPLVGRVFTDADDGPIAPPVVLISEGLWRSRFNGSPAVLGRPLDVDGISREIVGVMPSSFRFPAEATALWIPLQLDPANPPAAAFAYGAVARLKPGVTILEADRDFAAVLSRAPEIVPKFVQGITTRQILDQAHPIPVLAPLRDDIVGTIAGTLWVVAAAAALVLIVACANVANLTLVRADARQRETAVREALGAARGRLLTHVLGESAIVAALAGLVGLAVAAVAVRLLVSASPSGIPRLADVGIDRSVGCFAVLVTTFAAVFCGMLPALRLGRTGTALREGARGATTGRRQHRVRGALVAAQLALGLVILAGSGLLMRTFERLHAVQPGFDAEHLSTFWISLPAARYKSDPAIVEFYSRLADRVSALPDIQVVGLTSRLPLQSHGRDPNPLYPEDDPSYATRLPPLQLLTSVNADYFRVMGIPLLAGKTFERIGEQREGDAIVSSSTARVFWNDPSGIAALGKRFRTLPTGRLYTVVGVVGDVHDTGFADPPGQAVYFPETVQTDAASGQTKRTLALVVRERGDETPLADSIRRVLGDLDSTLPVFDVRPMTAVLADETAQLTLVIVILGAASTVTLVLGAVGLYGALAYVVTLRRRELGIRLALGASPQRVAATVARYGLTLALAGVAAGLALFALIARFVRVWLFDVAVSDPAALGGAALTLVAIAMLASWAPARRAARVDPVEALRAE